jgi:cGMP-dependent protein kinase 2
VTFADNDVNLIADAGARLDSGGGAGAGYKVAIVGSGPAGLSAAAHAARGGLSHVLLERAAHPNDTIFKYQKRKHVMATPEFLPLRSDLEFQEGSRETLIERWTDAAEALGINIRLGVEVTKITGEQGAFRLELADGEVLEAEFVVLAIGIQGNLNKLRLPGADLPFVQYQLDDPDEYRGEEIVVIGTGDAGLENALALTANNRFSIVNR